MSTSTPGRARWPLGRVSVRVRIVITVVVIAAAGLVAAGGLAYVVERDHTLASIDERQVGDVGVLRQIEAGQRGAAPASVNELLTRALQQIPVGASSSVFAATTADGVLIPGTPLPFRLDTDPAFVERVQKEALADVVVRGSSTVGERHVLYRIVPVSVAGDPATGLYVMGTDIDAELAQLGDAARAYLMVALLALAAVALAAWFVAGRLLLPIRQLRSVAESATDRDLEARVEVRGSDDVSELGRAVNRMLDRLQNAFAAQRQLADDVGHELRTPVTIVRGHLELMDAGDPRDVREVRDLAIDELDRMALLIDDLTLLARSDAPGFVQHSEIRISELTHSVLMKAEALSSQHVWVGAPPDLGLVSGDRRRLGQAWLQLAQNAAKYSPPGSRITIGSSGTADTVMLWVDDEGSGVPGSLATRVFSRFERAGRGPETAGSGLGLAIVAAIAESHGGTARLESRPGGGTRALIEIPRAAPRGVIVRAPDPHR